MADWNALRSYIKAKYKVAKDDLDTIHLLFETRTGRSQVVLVSDLGDDWAVVHTAVCEEHEIDLRDLLVRNSKIRVGSLALVDGGPVIFRHSFPLANLDPEEFEEPLQVAVEYGDSLEQEFARVDRF